MVPKALARRLIYSSHWLNLYVDKVRFPNGNLIEQHHLIDVERDAVMTLPAGSDGRFLMVQVCRYPTGRSEWEFPAGSVERGEDILTAARREVLEETGYHSTDYRQLYTYYPFNGMSNAIFHIVSCRVEERVRDFDRNEISDVGWFESDQIWQLIRTGQMKDGYTLTAFLLWQVLSRGNTG